MTEVSNDDEGVKDRVLQFRYLGSRKQDVKIQLLALEEEGMLIESYDEVVKRLNSTSWLTQTFKVRCTVRAFIYVVRKDQSHTPNPGLSCLPGGADFQKVQPLKVFDDKDDADDDYGQLQVGEDDDNDDDEHDNDDDHDHVDDEHYDDDDDHNLGAEGHHHHHHEDDNDDHHKHAHDVEHDSGVQHHDHDGTHDEHEDHQNVHEHGGV